MPPTRPASSGVLVPRETGVEYDVDHAVIGGEDRLVVLHNKDAVNFTLGVGAMDLSSLDELDTVIAPSDTVRVSGMTAQQPHAGGQPARGRADPGADLLDRRHRSAAGTNIDFDEPMYDVAAAEHLGVGPAVRPA